MRSPILTSLVVVLCLLGLSATAAHAQTVVSPIAAEFDDPDFTSLDGGQQVTTSYMLELWTPGSDTTAGIPNGPVSQIFTKAQTSQVAGAAVTRRRVLISAIGLTITPGPTWVATIKSIGPGGTARSAVSNPFTVPIPVRAPKAATGLSITDK